MKQAILELIDRKIEIRRKNSKNPELTDTCYTHIFILQELRQEIEAMDEWIPVTERLPEEGGTYLVINDDPSGEGVWVGTCLFHKSNGIWSYYYVTHWQPLPLPPNN